MEIRVAQGVYKPDQGAGITPGDQGAAFPLLNGVTLRGGYAGAQAADPDARDVDLYATVLSGDLDDNDTADWASRLENSDRVVTADLADATAGMNGLTITAGGRDGMRVSGGSPVLRNCTFTGNRDGLAIYEGSPSFLDCRFFANLGRGIYAWDCNSVLTNCVFGGNRIEAGGAEMIHCTRSHLTLRDCAFTENSNGGVHLSGTLELLRCSFVGNSGFGVAREAVDCRGTLTARECVFRANLGAVVSVHGDAALVDCTFVGNSADFGGAVSVTGDRLVAVRCVFSGNSGGGFGGGAITNYATYMELSHCTFVGNSVPVFGAGAIFDSALVARVSHCTFAGNRGQPTAIGHIWAPDTSAEMIHCIVWGGPEPFTARSDIPPEIAVTYSNVEGGYAGEGNIDVDPCFVDAGYWDASDTPDDPTDDVWVAGDYHLKSQAGHWDAESGSWVLDDVTSPCIDAGDPNGPINPEPFPNGGYANLGAYGGTAEASRSYFGEPVCTTQIAGDINGDCKVDDLDMDLLLSHWLMEDIGRANVPPTITLTSPTDGAEISYPASVVLRADAFDADGTVLKVSYVIQYRSGGTSATTGYDSFDRTDGWARPLDWKNIHHDGEYTIRAEAIDNEGAKTLSPEIKVTFHP